MLSSFVSLEIPNIFKTNTTFITFMFSNCSMHLLQISGCSYANGLKMSQKVEIKPETSTLAAGDCDMQNTSNNTNTLNYKSTTAIKVEYEETSATSLANEIMQIVKTEENGGGGGDYPLIEFIKKEDLIAENSITTPAQIKQEEPVLNHIVNPEPPPFLALKCIGCNETFNNDQLLRKHFLQEHARPKNVQQQITLPKLEIMDVDEDENDEEDDDDCDDEVEFNEGVDNANDDSTDSPKICCITRAFCVHALIKSQSNTWEPIMHCSICPESFKEYHLLRQHFSQQHPSHRFHILCCERKLYSKCQIDEHFSLHRNPRKYQCDICDSCHISKGNLRTHKKRLHSNLLNMQYVCNKCNKCFTSQLGLNSHLNSMHEGSSFRPQPILTILPNGARQYGCKICGYVCINRQKFKDHWSHSHRQVPKYKCEKCGKIDRIDVIQSHVRKHTANLTCPACGKVCKRKNDLTLHINLTHKAEREEIKKKLEEIEGPPPAVIRIDDDTFPCKYCSYNGNSMDSLRHHIEESHKREHKCKVCNMLFYLKRGLVAHMRMHKGEADESSSKRNVAIETEQPPPVIEHRCGVCDLRFEDYNEMRRHYFTHKKGNMFMCALCHQQFKYANSLKRHHLRLHANESEEEEKEQNEKNVQHKADEETSDINGYPIATNNKECTKI
ncbi:zinc finger protein 532-like isoform X3 [Musca autumnalis]|uniref:zinc finger protein 532-like isoform X3 n=2 Tax=Musca autumnalis TaxID=221902 RepID=UPI003CF8C621